MSETVSKDAIFATDPSGEEGYVLQHRPGSIPSGMLEALINNFDPNVLCLYGRSALGQMGVNIIPVGEPFFTGSGRNITAHTPIQVEAFTPIGESFVDDLSELSKRKRPGSPIGSKRYGRSIAGGRYVDFDNLVLLETAAETRKALDRNLLAINTEGYNDDRKYVVNDDGSITMPIGLVQTLLSDYTLDSRAERMNVVKHGRSALKPHSSTEMVAADKELPAFFVGGIPFSTGPYICVIRNTLDEEGNIIHLSGATLLDGNRTEGIGSHLAPYTRHRQIEVVNTLSGQTFGNTNVTIDIYRDYNEDPNPAIDWWNMSLDGRAKVHRDGVSPLDVIHASDPTARDRMKATYKNRKVGGVVMSAHGANEVPVAESDELMAAHVEKAARSFGRDRGLPKHLQIPLGPYVDKLGVSGDRSRVFVGERLLAEYIPQIVARADVQSWQIEDIGNPFMSQQTHSALLDLVRSGTSIAWDRDGDVRRFHRSGYWVNPEEIESFENLAFVIAMYGTHKKGIDEVIEPKLDEFFQLYSTLMNPERLGVTHGNGPGLMRMSDVLARKYGIKSLGVSILVEGQEEGQDIYLPNGFAHFLSGMRLYRQQMMDWTRYIAVNNVGGFGTIEETGINVCSNKLNLCVPSPTIMFDPEGDFYDPIIRQFHRISSRGEMKLFGETVDISDKPMGQPWVTNTIHQARDYTSDDGVFGIIKDYVEDPADYFDKARIPKAEVLKGFYAHVAQLAIMGWNMPGWLRRGVMEYAG